MIDSLLASYEAVPYDSKPIAASEMAVLETIARLHGLSPAPAVESRVLELGCAAGGNLIPMAVRYPRSTFVGIDLTPGQIALGNNEVEALGLGNITLSAMSIADVTDALGEFDYIICHGVYSWVPPEVQDATLRVCARNLAPSGIAYVSYNTLPGWHVRSMVREMVMYHDDPSLPAPQRVARALALVDTLVEHGKSPPTPHVLTIMEESMTLKEQGIAHFLHEQLEPFNEPVYFSEFVRRASDKGLRFVAEASLSDSSATLAAWAAEAAGDASDVVRAQQYMDFASGRTFRRTLLCHDDLNPSPQPMSGAVAEMYLAMRAIPAKPSDEDRAKGPGVASYQSPNARKVTTNNPLILGAFDVLLRVAPASLSFGELLRRVNDRMDATEMSSLVEQVDRSEQLSQAMLQCAVGALVELSRQPAAFTTVVSERPVAHPVARLHAPFANAVPNFRHMMAELTEFERALIVYMDGSRTRSQLAARLLADIAEGKAEFKGDKPGHDALVAAIDASLGRMATVALLEC